MPVSPKVLTAFRFEGFELDVRAGELRRPDGGKTRLGEQPFRILIVLLENPGGVVLRETIRKKLWPNDTIVEFEHSIGAAMNRLRQALGDSADKPKYIETLARRGYRWMTGVERVEGIPAVEMDGSAEQKKEMEAAGGDLIGRTVSHYKVLELLGAGGMGIVYKAEDVKLSRRVALKFLPEGMASDPRALERFQREALAISGLDHPNICTIYEVEEHVGQPFLVMQLLEGQTLRERIESHSGHRACFRNEELLDISLQIASGLEAAHQKGLIHRDIKPANIFLTNRGEAKILDFGLAKLVESAEPHETLSPQNMPDGAAVPESPMRSTVTRSLTGLALGTPAYLSPEQVSGEKLDARTDVYSFGLVLYEMATGIRAISGNTAPEIHDAILDHPPRAVRELNPEVSRELEQIVHRAINKDQEARYRDASEMHEDLLRLKRGASEGLTPKALRILGAALSLVLLFAVGIWWFARKRTEAPLPPLEVVPMAALAGFEGDPAFSPDGNQVAFAFAAKDKSGIYTILIGDDKALRLTTGAGDCYPTWSPDGRRVAFYRFSDHGTAIYAIPALGGTEQRLHAGFSGPLASGLDWSPDGKVLAFSEGQEDKNRAWISLLSFTDSTTRHLTSPSGQEYDSFPAFSPDGSTVAFVRGIVAGAVSDLYVVPAAGGTPKRLTNDNTWIRGAPTWTSDGREIVFSSARGGLDALWRISATGGTPPRPVAGVGVVAWAPSISPRGNQLVYQQMAFKDSVFRLDLKDDLHRQGPPMLLRSEKGFNWRPQFSPDGKRFVYETNGLGYSELWACDSDGTHCGSLTSLRGTAGAARWSPDGRFIAFEFRPKDHSEIYLLEVGGGAPKLLSTLPGSDNGGPSWSRDGKSLYFYSDRGGEPFQLWKAPVSGGTPVQITKHGGVFAAESWDGRALYYSKLQVPGIFKMPLQGGEEERVLDRSGGGEWFNWALSRNGIYFRATKNNDAIGVLNFFDFATRKITMVSTLDQPGGIGIGLSADGRSILYDGKGEVESSIMLVKNFR